MARDKTNFYVGNLLSQRECFVIDPTGLPCADTALTDDPFPMCRRHTWEVKVKLQNALARPVPSLVGP